MPPAGPEWLHEMKHDGFRLMVWRDRGRVRLFIRNGHDWAERYPAIVAAAAALQARSFLIDGEAVIADGRGVASFNLLRSRTREAHAFVWAFDILELDGEDLRHLPLERRKERRKVLLKRAPLARPVATFSLASPRWSRRVLLLRVEKPRGLLFR